jgi:histone-lysine N-methyltransferase SETD3
MKIIAEDQEEPLPLNWAIIVEEWDNTYWIVWILLLWILWDRGGDDFEIEHLNLFGWLQDWYG